MPGTTSFRVSSQRIIQPLPEPLPKPLPEPLPEPPTEPLPEPPTEPLYAPRSLEPEPSPEPLPNDSLADQLRDIARHAIAATLAPSTLNIKETLVWTKDMEYLMFSQLLEQQERGKRADIGFKKEAWAIVLAIVQTSYRGPLLITLE